MGCGCNKTKEQNKNVNSKETFDTNGNFLSKYWIFIIIGIIIIIVLIYYFILRNKSEDLEFKVMPEGFIRGRLEDYTVDL